MLLKIIPRAQSILFLLCNAQTIIASLSDKADRLKIIPFKSIMHKTYNKTKFAAVLNNNNRTHSTRNLKK